MDISKKRLRVTVNVFQIVPDGPAAYALHLAAQTYLLHRLHLCQTSKAENAGEHIFEQTIRQAN